MRNHTYLHRPSEERLQAGEAALASVVQQCAVDEISTRELELTNANLGSIRRERGALGEPEPSR